ncbi:MAG: TonB-dependent receptor [Prevotella sp.]|nr:TonB-dependent receptor [Prevotella sp.]
MRIKITILLAFLNVAVMEAQNIICKVVDAKTQEAIVGAVVTQKSSKKVLAITDIDGKCELSSSYEGNLVVITYVGYKSLTIPLKNHAIIPLRQNAIALGEVVVTARASDGPVTSSIIGRDAMTHLQPNSIADLMELLPGGYAKDPNMGEANTITLRETGTMGAYGAITKNNNYSISSLGTQFMVDGVPISTDANLQYSPLSDTQSSASSSTVENNRNITNRGVDMRSISTDDIESVEVVRGIPSVEYGNLTSGLINIKKIRRAIPLTARFKADGYSKLFSLGKGLQLDGEGNSILNVDLGYMDSKIDPTDNFENYKRVTGALRYTLRGDRKEKIKWQWNSAFDYSGSFDDSKSDPDINYGRVDEYKSSYSRLALTNGFNVKMPKSWFKELDVNTLVSLQLDRLRQTRLVAPQRYGIVPLSWSDGENEAQAVYAEYTAHYLCDGKPFNAYVKVKGVMGFKTPYTLHTIKVGANWDLAKNFGRGQVYDMHHPLSVSGWSLRPRKYSDIPSLQNFSLFAEELMKANVGKCQLELMVGLRLNTLLGLERQFDMSGKYYADPRANLAWHLPKFKLGGKPMSISLNGGYGITTKMPTLNYLYPDKYYSNFICMAYYDTANPEQDSKFVVHTYVQDPTNYHIKPARNHKWEIRLDMDWNDNRLSVDYFRESMTSGFRYSTIYGVYDYKSYDVTQMAAGMDYTTLPYENKRVLDGYQQASNGSELVKQGIELAFTSQRIRCLRTRINVTGAWFHTKYTNSQPLFSPVSTVIDGRAVREKYVGLYNWNDGRENDRLNTNVTFDTQIPEWKLIFTTSVQCMWMIRTKQMWKNGTPMAYMSYVDGQLHDFKDADRSDPYLMQLVRTYNEEQFKPFTVPMSMLVNLKVTKEIGKYMRLSFFANKILDYLPDYTANGKVIRRNASPYFGVEAGFTI